MPCSELPVLPALKRFVAFVSEFCPCHAREQRFTAVNYGRFCGRRATPSMSAVRKVTLPHDASLLRIRSDFSYAATVHA